MSRRRRVIRLMAQGAASAPTPERFHWVLNGIDESLYDSDDIELGFSTTWSLFLSLSLTSDPAGAGYILMLRRGSNNNDSIYVLVQPGPSLSILARNTSGTTFKQFDASFATLGITEGVGFTLGISFDGDTAGDPMLVYINGVDVTSSFTKTVDTTGTMADSAREVSFGAFRGSSNFLEYKLQHVILIAGAKSPSDFATMDAQAGTENPLLGISGGVHHWTPQAEDAAQYVDVIGARSLTGGNMDNSNRVQGNLVS